MPIFHKKNSWWDVMDLFATTVLLIILQYAFSENIQHDASTIFHNHNHLPQMVSHQCPMEFVFVGKNMTNGQLLHPNSKNINRILSPARTLLNLEKIVLC
jgi:hypothetical protein